MAQDRPATNWSVTAFDDEIKLCEDTQSWPSFVKKVLGGREVAPTTGRLHFQGMINCARQVRMTQIKSWLPTAHLEPCRDKEALKKYVMKLETATGEKKEIENPHKYMRHVDVMMLIAKHYDWATHQLPWDNDQQFKRRSDRLWSQAVTKCVLENPDASGLFANPGNKKFFLTTAQAWFELSLKAQTDRQTDTENIQETGAPRLVLPEGTEEEAEPPTLEVRQVKGKSLTIVRNNAHEHAPAQAPSWVLGQEHFPPEESDEGTSFQGSESDGDENCETPGGDQGDWSHS